jgi:hypothetical protein
MELTLVALRQAGVYSYTIEMWGDKADDDQTYANFECILPDRRKSVSEMSPTRQLAITVPITSPHPPDLYLHPPQPPLPPKPSSKTINRLYF